MEAFSEDLFSVFEDNKSNTKKSENGSNQKKRKEIEISSDSSSEDAKKSKKDKKKSKETKKSKTEDQDVEMIQETTPSSGKKSKYDYVNDTLPPVPTSSSAPMVIENGATLLEEASKTEEAPSRSIKQMITNGDSEIISCLHEIVFPPLVEGKTPTWDDAIYNPVFPAAPARTWKFNLDPFQKMAVACLERGDSVMVSAHTSAGKTVIAEYAIAMSLKNNQRVIYTSPIKALSNQKYRELYESFSDVGLMTGDITINPTASCLVMTTEILRNMLYRGSEVMREVAWVIFDEIHYMRDKERGVVWEETIILCPDKVRYVFLSATIPNAKEFAGWIAKVHDQPCHVVYTDVRPTPLQHYIFPSGGDGLHLVVDEKGNFKEENFQKALASLAVTATPDNQRKKKKKQGPQSDIYKIVKMIIDKNYDPVIVFSFSKKECEALALQMAKLDLNKEEEKKLVDEIFNNAVDSLSEDDKKLPQVVHILPLLKRGIGIHHSGLLPILKETIEILFQEGLLKCLFATETFAMGLNMPAKTVVFTNVRKFDGENFRWITSGEYIQMSGRAGRRGLDDRGIVILMVDEKMEPSVAKNMIKGSADPLNSSFYISYNMLLNLLRVEGIDPEYMLKRSFHQFQNDRALPEVEKRIKRLEMEKDSINIVDEEAVQEYHLLREQLTKLKQVVRETVNEPIHILPFLQPGRLARVKDGETDWGWGVIVNFQKKQEKNTSDNQGKQYIVDVLLNCSPETSGKPKPAASNDPQNLQVVPVLLPLMNGLSTIRVYIPKDLRDASNRQSVGKSLKEVSKRFPDGIPMLDPIEDMKIETTTFKKAIRKIESLEDKLYSTPAFKSDDLMVRYQLYTRKMSIENELKTIRKHIKNGESVILKSELKSMKRVLRRLGYASQEDIIETKGRVACEINATDAAELIITELMFSGVFNDLEIEQCASLLSCFVFQEKVDANLRLKEEIAVPYRKLQETARRIAKVAQESKINIDTEEYLTKFSPHMMDVVYSWAKGAKFSEICGMTDIFEGSIIRCMRRLEELLRQLCSAAKAIGNSELENKFAEAINKLKRDIVFAASLYL